jgi:hypothetical protein
MSHAEDRAVSQNVWVNAPVEIAQAVLQRVLDRGPDIVGLQEWPSGRNPLLKATGTFARFPMVRRVLRGPWRPGEGVEWARPLLGPTGPIGLRADRYEVLACSAVTLTGSRRIRPTERHPRARLPANRATLAVAHDHELDEEVAVIGYHLWAGVQVGGHYSERPSDRARVDGHRDQVAALGRLVIDQLARGRVVYALGDSNFDGLDLPGLVSAWDGREHERRGTHEDGHRKIDDVFGPGRAVRVEVIEHPEQQIDHQGVLAVRRRGQT